MSRDRSGQGGGYDGGDPDAEIDRLRREHEAEQQRRANDEERRRIAESERIQREGQ